MAKKTKQNTITLNEFLCSHSGTKRNLDKVIYQWYIRKYNSYEKRTIEEWSEIIDKFFKETEK